jgi:uncharacterized membrane protein (UPF0127 family)
MNRTMIVVSSTVSILSALLCLPVVALPKKAQMLPIEAQTTLKGKTIQLEVARTVEQQATGLMFRTELAEDRGMIFLFNPPTPINFWMKNTLIPLDMVFTHSGKVVYLQRNAPPCKTLDCPVYGAGPQQLVDQVIELQAGTIDRLKLNVADPITVEFSKTVKTRALKPGAPRAIRPL